MPKVSVVICIYNHCAFIQNAVRSVQSQSYTDWECLIVDDASTDSTPEIVAQLVAEDNRIRYIRNKTNLGVGASRNIGNALATGEWIAVLDADDWWAPDKLRVQLEALQKVPGAVFCFSGHMSVSDTDKKVVLCPQTWVKELDLGLRMANLILHSSVVVSREAMSCAGGYDEKLLSAHDWDFYLRLLLRWGSRAFVYVDEPLTFYRVHGDSISSNWRRMLSDERTIIWRYFSRGAWALRHPVGAHRVVSEQLHKEMKVLEWSGRPTQAFLRSFMLLSLSPHRRWLWLEFTQRLTTLMFGPRPLSDYSQLR
jgi:glycosyltransferase involved in cell wall biosynthesis